MSAGARILLCLFLLIFNFVARNINAEPGRYVEELSGEGWKLWLDLDAKWRNDPVSLPPVQVKALPVNEPSCGWGNLEKLYDKDVSVPGTVEEHFWGANGNIHGIAGDYRGVSWWSRTFMLDSSLHGKKIALLFDSVNLRAEIYVNRRLIGYDVVGNTPFEVDITDVAEFGKENCLDVRITDPVGNFTWEDNDIMRWGNNSVPAVHGFGGITGKVFIRATDSLYIDNIYVENKPSVTDAEIFVTMKNETGSVQNGNLTIKVHEWLDPDEVIWEKTQKTTVAPDEQIYAFKVNASHAKPWNIRDAHLYTASVIFTEEHGAARDSAEQRFGFRYFTVDEKNGDKRFYLNGKRVFLFAAMTRGFWPKNGMFPTPEMARRDVEMTVKLGYNMMLFHRAIGQHYVTELCDEAGILVYEEPGGYRCTPDPDDMSKTWRREKLKRMVIRDRSYPSMVIYNLKNEASNPPDDDDIANVRMVHELDPGRIITYNSDRNRDIPYTESINPDPYKLHMLPFDDTLYYHGWFDHHHWFAYGGYVDTNYNNPEFYLRGVVDAPVVPTPADSVNSLPRDEIIFWGEEGQWGTMMRLEKIRNELLRTGADGFREQKILHLYDNFDRFLDESGFRKFFPTVDDFTLSMGENLHYFHGRSLENVRMGNISDGYNLNGWAAPETSEDIVSVYRFPTADTAILSYYAQPLYIAVKIHDKVLSSGMSAVADFFIINEENIRGKHTLDIHVIDPEGKVIYSNSQRVNILGGEEYGQLLVRDVVLPAVDLPGYYTVKAELKSGEKIVTSGCDEIFTVDYTGVGLRGSYAVIDTSGTINAFLEQYRGVTLPEFDPGEPAPDCIVIGSHDFARASAPYKSRYINPVMECAANGSTVIILDQADTWAEMMTNNHRHPALEYTRSVSMGNNGRLIAGNDPVLDGLPVEQAMNWEYQTFYRGNVWGLDMTMKGTEQIVALVSQNRKDIVSALTRIPYMRGQIYLCTLNILSGLASATPQSSMAKKLFLNLLEKSAENLY
ncbi:MAG: hypothetical protein JXB48_08315 [Candidatus Latescibacteria bacterium]|nr:hypothetical protein [Candidatus Latescibacterota bacterium]